MRRWSYLFILSLLLPLVVILLPGQMEAASMRGADRVSPAAQSQAEENGDPLPWRCYDAGTFDPCQRDLYALDGRPGGPVWAVGRHGAAWRWDGEQWSYHPVPVSGYVTDLYGVDVRAAGDVWAVGMRSWDLGAIFYHWDGNSWQELPADPIGLLDVEMITATDGWATGMSGLYHWDGNSWSQMASDSVSYPNRNVAALTESDVWAGGTGGQMWHWDGSTLTKTVLAGRADVMAMDALAPDNVWAVGAYQANWQWDGAEWASAPVTYTQWPGHFIDVQMLAAADGWVLGDRGRVLRWDGDTWGSDDYIGPGLRSLYFSAPDRGWVAGEFGQMFAWNGSEWQAEGSSEALLLDQTLNDIVVTADDGWAVGDSGTVLQWDGVAWSPVDVPEAWSWKSLVGVVSSADHGVWIAGPGDTGLRRLPGAEAWEEVSLPATILAASSEGLWAAGVSGTGGSIVRWNGSAWEETAPDGMAAVRALDFVAPDDGWALTDGSYARWNGSNWITGTAPFSGRVRALDMLSASDGWAVSDEMAYHWDGSEWSVFPLPLGEFEDRNEEFVQDMVMADSDAGWIATNHGQILRWDGSAWIVESTGSGHKLRALALAENGRLWAVGEGPPLTTWYTQSFDWQVYMPLVQ